MKERAPELPKVGAGGIPVALLLGPCIELWADEDPPSWCEPDRWPRMRAASAWRHWSNARGEYLTSIGLPWPRRAGQIPSEVEAISSLPWSIDWLAERAPDQLVERLARVGLPADWRP